MYDQADGPFWCQILKVFFIVHSVYYNSIYTVLINKYTQFHLTYNNVIKTVNSPTCFGPHWSIIRDYSMMDQ